MTIRNQACSHHRGYVNLLQSGSQGGNKFDHILTKKMVDVVGFDMSYYKLGFPFP
jgi:hypothetical protein